MTTRSTTILGMLALTLSVLALTPAAAAEPQALEGTVLAPPPAEDEMPGDPPGAFDVRVVVAAPRAAITGRAGSVMLAARMGRTIHVLEGQTVRFVSGLKEAVWYAGAGSVESTLAVFAVLPDGTRNLLGRDGLLVAGDAPKIDAGRARVDVPFPAVGEITLEVVMKGAANPRNGRGASRTVKATYTVRVEPAGAFGSIAGFVRDEAGGRPVPGLRVVAIDAGTRDVVAAAETRCDGAYELRRLLPGSYLVAVQAARGFRGEFYDDVTDPALATPVNVAAGVPTAPIDFLLAHD